MSDFEVGFSNDLYYEAQMEAFEERIHRDMPQVIEFGGKPFGDYHAARVLPGYDADIKASILRDVHYSLGSASIAMVVHAQDLMPRPDGRRIARRLRGDSGFTYDEEVKRLAEEARERFQIPINAAVVTALPNNLSGENQEYMAGYLSSLKEHFDVVRTLPAHNNYPFLEINGVVDQLTSHTRVTDTGESLIVISPGGGSGKFGVAASELAHKLSQGAVPNFIKFETFPVFNLPPVHPLNQAFMAATADLDNKIVEVGNGSQILTNYDKDVNNLRLLKTLLYHFIDTTTPLHEFEVPTDMGVNVIERGIVNPEVVEKACKDEIVRRLGRYAREIALGLEEYSTLEKTQQIHIDLAVAQSTNMEQA